MFHSSQNKRSNPFCCFTDLENGRVSSDDEEVVNQLEQKLNVINKHATDVYNSIISNAQVSCLTTAELFTMI